MLPLLRVPLRRRVLRVRGHSMLPTLAGGDLVVVRSVRTDLPDLGSLVVVTDPGEPDRMLVKRVASTGTATFSVRSDNPCEGRDSRHFGSLRAEHLVGTVGWVFPCR